MKLPILVSAILFAVVAENAIAGCSTDDAKQVKINKLPALLTGNTICVSGAGGTWEAQQELHSNGELWDYKKGDGDAVDPRKKEGTWKIRGKWNWTKLVFDYGSGGKYKYRVWKNGGGSYSLCGAEVWDVTVKKGVNVGCD